MDLKRLTNIALNNDYICYPEQLIKASLFVLITEFIPGSFIKEKVKTFN